MSKKNELFSGFHHLAITKRITLLYGGIFTVSLLFLSLFMLWNIPDMQRSTTRRELQHTMESVQEYLSAGKMLTNGALMQMQEDGYVEVNIYQFADNTMFSTMGELPSFIHPPDRMEWTENRPPYLQEKELRQKGFEINIRRESPDGRVEYIIENKSEQKFMLISEHFKTDAGLYRIQVFRRMADGDYMVLNFMSKLLIADVIGVFCAFLIGQYISRRMLKPVAAIREAAERISIEDLSQRISTEGPEDEMKELTETFNSMIDRLEGSFQKQNQFVSDASHELRTPISVIQGYANLINRWGKSDPAVLQESIDSILTETEHMSALIRQLLFLAKSDQSRLSLQKTEISLNEVSAELVREMALLNTQADISYTEEDQVEIFADYNMIKQLLWIHGENALKYAKENAKVEVKVWKDQEFGYVSVKDDGVGISEEDIPKIFDRFYRADKSRNKEILGTGLGLSIAKWIMDSHDGEILVESRVDEGTVFTNRFHLMNPEIRNK